MEGHSTMRAHDVIAGLRAAQNVQTDYDEAMWDISDPEHSNVRHIHIHLSITCGKLARLIEQHDHDDYHGRDVDLLSAEDLAPIVADLVMHAAQLANQVGLDLGDAFAGRYRQNAARFAPESDLVQFGVVAGGSEG